jgi:4-hydroxymandelate synthase
MSISGIDHVEFYVGDLQAAAASFCRDFGFAHAAGEQVLAGRPGCRSVLLRQGAIALLLTAAETPGHPAAEYVERHGDGVASIAFRTDDVAKAFDQAVVGGARPIAAPAFGGHGTGHGAGRVREAVVSGFGDVTHRFVERAGPAAGQQEHARGAGDHAPGPQDHEAGQQDHAGLFAALDHVAVCLPAGQIAATVRLYREAFGFANVFAERIEVNGQAMISQVVQDETGAVTFTLIEPDPDRDPGQIDQFLGSHGGAGVQHLALRTADIAQAVRTLSARGVKFLSAPGGYYRRLEPRLGSLAISVDVLREVNVLADRDKWGELFQIFTRSTHERGTFFIELIERRGALTFGSGNIKALYEALGEEQASMTPTAPRG